MSYIGKTPTVGNFQVCDAISVVNNQAAYTMQVGSVNVSPESANHMIVSLNGVIQKPTDAFTVSGSTITFASNLVTGDVINFIQILGNVLDLGVPSDGTVSTAKLVSTSVTAAKLNNDIITGQTAETSIADGDTILIHDASASALRKMTKANFVSGVGGATTPAFYAQAASNQSWSDDATAKIIFGTEVYDTNNTFASSRFTPGVAGTYKIYCGIQVGTASTAYGAVDHCRLQLYKNGSSFIRADYDSRGSSQGNGFVSFTLNGNWSVVADDNDYYEIYVYADTNPSTPVAYSLGGGVNFGAFRLIT